MRYPLQFVLADTVVLNYVILCLCELYLPKPDQSNIWQNLTKLLHPSV